MAIVEMFLGAHECSNLTVGCSVGSLPEDRWVGLSSAQWITLLLVVHVGRAGLQGCKEKLSAIEHCVQKKKKGNVFFFPCRNTALPPEIKITSFQRKIDISVEEHRLSGQQHVYLEPKFPACQRCFLCKVLSFFFGIWNLWWCSLTSSSEESRHLFILLRKKFHRTKGCCTSDCRQQLANFWSYFNRVWYQIVCD